MAFQSHWQQVKCQWLVATLLNSQGKELVHRGRKFRRAEEPTTSTEWKSSENTTVSPAAGTAASREAATQLLGRKYLPRRRDICEDTEPTRWGTLHRRTLTNRAAALRDLPTLTRVGSPRGGALPCAPVGEGPDVPAPVGQRRWPLTSPRAEALRGGKNGDAKHSPARSPRPYTVASPPQTAAGVKMKYRLPEALRPLGRRRRRSPGRAREAR